MKRREMMSIVKFFLLTVLLKNLGLKDNIFLVIVDVYLLRSARICSQEIL